MAKLTTLQHFNSIGHLTSSYGVTLPRTTLSPWRLVPTPFVGNINGIPSLRGTMLATDGVLCLITRDEKLELAHLDWFVPDGDQTAKEVVAKQSNTKAKKPTIDLSEFV